HGLLEASLIEHGLRRSASGRRVLIAGDRRHLWSPGQQSAGLGLPKELDREVVPGTGGLATEVIQAPGELYPTGMSGGQRQQHLGDTSRISRATDLVDDHRQGIALARQAKHGFDEVVPVRTEHPAGTQNQMLLEAGSNGLFAGLLAGTVDTCRGYAVGFPVRSIGRTG